MTNSKHNVDIHIGAEVDKEVIRGFEDIKKNAKGSSDALKKANEKGKSTGDALKHSNDKLSNSVGGTARGFNRFGLAIGNAARKAREYARNIRLALKNNNALGKSLNLAGRGLDKFSNKWTGIGGAVSLGAGANYVVDLEAKHTRLGTQANRSKKEIEALKDEVFKISNLPAIRVDPSQVTAAIEKIVEKTGDLDLAQRNIKNIAMTIGASGAAGSDVGSMIADLNTKFGIKSEGDTLNMLDLLVRQGEGGAFTLQHISRFGERVTAAYAKMKRTGPEAIKEMGALLQIAKHGGTAEEGSTAFAGMLRDLISREDKLRDMGVELYDPEEKAKGKEVGRSIPKVLKEIMIATGGNTSELQKIFTDDAFKAIGQIANDYQKTGRFDELDKYMSIKGDGQELMKDSAINADTAAAAITFLTNSLKKLADDSLTGPIKSLASALNSLEPETLQTLLKTLSYGLLGLGGLAIGRKAVNFFRGKKNPKGGPGGPGSPFAPGNVTPVFVTNMGDMGGGGFGGSEKDRKKDRKRQRRIKRLRSRNRMGMVKNFFGSAGRVAGRVAAPLAAIGGVASIGSTLLDDSLSKAEKTKEVSGTAGGIAGGIGGAAAGAALGTMIVPVIGTAIGGIIGGLIGSFGGSAMGSGIAGWFVNDKDKTSIGKATKKTLPVSDEQQQLQKNMAQTKDQQLKTLQSAAAPGVLYNQQQQHSKISKSDVYTLHVTQNITQQPGENSQQLSQRISEELEKLMDKMQRKNDLSFNDGALNG